MTSIINVLDQYVFPGITGNSAYDLLKSAWKRVRRKSWEVLLLDAFDLALKDLRPNLAKHASLDGEIGIDRAALSKILHQDLIVSPDVASFIEITEDSFLVQMAHVMEEHSILIIGGHNLTSDSYAQIILKLIYHARSIFETTIRSNEEDFRKALFDLAVDNHELLQNVVAYLKMNFGILQEIQISLSSIEHKVDRLPVLEQKIDILLASNSTEFLGSGANAFNGTRETYPAAVELSHSELLKNIFSASAILRSIRNEIYGTTIHLKRPEVEQIFEWVQRATSQKRLAAVIGRPGDGKTIIMQEILTRLEAENIPVLGVKIDVPSNETSGQDFTKLSELIEGVERGLNEGEILVVLIDQLDALSMALQRDQSALHSVFGIIARLQNTERVRIIVSCRSFDLQTDPILSNLTVDITFSLNPLPVEEVNKVLQILGKPDLHKMSLAYQDLLTVPLYLDLYAQIIADDAAQNSEEFETLQDFYQRLWEMRVEREFEGVPHSSTRRATVYKLVDDMQHHHRASAPVPTLDDYPDAAKYLREVGFIKLEGTRWFFLHSTLFDYCYARKFLYEQKSLFNEILSSPQGLFERSQMMQVLTYVRAADENALRRELHSLLYGTKEQRKLRPHLRLLLIEWLGWLANPSDYELSIVRQLLRDTDDLKHFFLTAGGNSGWFGLLQEEIRSQLDSQNDWITVQYLVTFFQGRAQDVLTYLQPYLGRDERWDGQIVWSLSCLKDWDQGRLAVDMLCDLLRRSRIAGTWLHQCFYFLGPSNPKGACLALRVYLDQQLDDLLKLMQTSPLTNSDPILSIPGSLWHGLWKWEEDTLNEWHVRTLLQQIVEACPIELAEHLLPWFLRAATSFVDQNYVNDKHYRSSVLFFSLDQQDEPSPHGISFGLAIVNALQHLALTRPAEFRIIADELIRVDVSVVQRALALSYMVNPEVYAEDIFTRLTSDIRWLYLPESINSYTAAFIHTKQENRPALERLVLDLQPDKRNREHWARLQHDQLAWLGNVPKDLLSKYALRKLQELERRFPPNREKFEQLVGSVTWEVTSPIPQTSQEKMSCEDWRKAMLRYNDSTDRDASRSSSGGGVGQLSRDFATFVKEYPLKCYELIQSFDEAISILYIIAAISGLSDSDAPASEVFDVVRRYKLRIVGHFRTEVCRTLMKRAQVGIPDDILDLIEDWALNDPDPDIDEERQQIAELAEQNDKFYDVLINKAINSVRGVAVGTVSDFGIQRSPAQTDRVLRLLKRATQDTSSAVRVAAVRAIGAWVTETNDISTGIDLFERALDGYPLLLSSATIHNYLNWMCFHNFARGRVHIEAMLTSPNDFTREAGARLACLSAFRHADASYLVEHVMKGDAVMRRGSAQIYARNVDKAEVVETCIGKLLQLMTDTDEEVRKEVAQCFWYLPGQIDRFASFIRSFISSPTLPAGAERLVAYLEKNLTSDPADHGLTLEVVEHIVNTLGRELGDIRTAAAALQYKIVPILLQIYHLSEDHPTLQTSAIDLFERLLLLEGVNEARAALRESDKDWISTWIAKNR